MRETSKPRRVTLRARLTLIYGGMFFVAGVVLLGVTYALFSAQVHGLGTAKVVLGGKRGPDAPPSGSTATTDPSPERGAPPLAPPPKAFVRTGDGDVLTGPAAEKWMRDQQGRLRDAATASLITQGGIALTVVGGAAAGLGWLIAGRVLAPLHRVTDTARRIAAAPAAGRGLHERISLSGPDDEVKDLADTFDTMVERLDRSFDGQRRFVANASHELRTPLTLGRALVELAMHRKTASEDVRQLGESLLQINTRHDRLITGLLLLATSENEVTERRPVDMADVLGHVVAQTAAEAERAAITVHEEADEAISAGDALLLERMVENLVENGIRHNTAGADEDHRTGATGGDGGAGAGGWVRVVSRTRGDGRAEIEVSNTGPVVPPYEIPSLFEPFRRLGTGPQGRTGAVGAPRVTGKGVGLGLSIVRSVAHAHGGEVAARPRDGGGLVVTVTLPGRPAGPLRDRPGRPSPVPTSQEGPPRRRR
ncbi:sensor histidine kinase [Streptomyces sp. NPDC018031]|uniref:sensor histidine kinase n=1 Tax=Streptomyces sp. NPDC018031 TaxID=3365033 RepID=UPI0037983374